jgi:hypothetical protein
VTVLQGLGERGFAMTNRWLIGGVLFLGLAAARADDNPFEAYEKAAKPGPEHKKLDPIVGNWNWAGKFWMTPDAKPVESKGTAVRKWVMGGRFVQDEVACKGGPFGDFNGFGLTGYDNIQKKYNGVWTDSMTTSLSTSLGTVDKSGKVFTFHKEDLDPVSGKRIKGKDVIKIVGDDEHHMEMYKEVEGKEVKVMELVFKRVKK